MSLEEIIPVRQIYSRVMCDRAYQFSRRRFSKLLDYLTKVS